MEARFDDPQGLPRWSAGAHGAIAAFSTRQGGVSTAPWNTLNLGRSTGDRPEAVAENRRRLLAALGLDPGRLATAGQVHGRTVVRVAAAGLHPECDALVSTVPGLALAVSAADCLPIAYLTPGAVAVAHSGWRGTAAGMPRAALETCCQVAGVRPDHVHVHLGPSIRSCCYRVGPEVALQFPASVRRPHEGGFRLDLAAAALEQLREAGIDPAHVFDVGECTACRPDRYFSHRRDQGRTGRQWAVVARVEPEPAP